VTVLVWLRRSVIARSTARVSRPAANPASGCHEPVKHDQRLEQRFGARQLSYPSSIAITAALLLVGGSSAPDAIARKRGHRTCCNHWLNATVPMPNGPLIGVSGAASLQPAEAAHRSFDLVGEPPVRVCGHRQHARVVPATARRCRDPHAAASPFRAPAARPCSATDTHARFAAMQLPMLYGSGLPDSGAPYAFMLPFVVVVLGAYPIWLAINRRRAAPANAAAATNRSGWPTPVWLLLYVGATGVAVGAGLYIDSVRGPQYPRGAPTPAQISAEVNRSIQPITVPTLSLPPVTVTIPSSSGPQIMTIPGSQTTTETGTASGSQP
jgi:hypothetical protein